MDSQEEDPQRRELYGKLGMEMIKRDPKPFVDLLKQYMVDYPVYFSWKDITSHFSEQALIRKGLSRDVFITPPTSPSFDVEKQDEPLFHPVPTQQQQQQHYVDLPYDVVIETEPHQQQPEQHYGKPKTVLTPDDVLFVFETVDNLIHTKQTTRMTNSEYTSKMVELFNTYGEFTYMTKQYRMEMDEDSIKALFTTPIVGHINLNASVAKPHLDFDPEQQYRNYQEAEQQQFGSVEYMGQEEQDVLHGSILSIIERLNQRNHHIDGNELEMVKSDLLSFKEMAKHNDQITSILNEAFSILQTRTEYYERDVLNPIDELVESSSILISSFSYKLATEGSIPNEYYDEIHSMVDKIETAKLNSATILVKYPQILKALNDNLGQLQLFISSRQHYQQQQQQQQTREEPVVGINDLGGHPNGSPLLGQEQQQQQEGYQQPPKGKEEQPKSPPKQNQSAPDQHSNQPQPNEGQDRPQPINESAFEEALKSIATPKGDRQSDSHFTVEHLGLNTDTTNQASWRDGFRRLASFKDFPEVLQRNDTNGANHFSLKKPSTTQKITKAKRARLADVVETLTAAKDDDIKWNNLSLFDLKQIGNHKWFQTHSSYDPTLECSVEVYTKFVGTIWSKLLQLLDDYSRNIRKRTDVKSVSSSSSSSSNVNRNDETRALSSALIRSLSAKKTEFFILLENFGRATIHSPKTTKAAIKFLYGNMNDTMNSFDNIHTGLLAKAEKAPWVKPKDYDLFVDQLNGTTEWLAAVAESIDNLNKRPLVANIRSKPNYFKNNAINWIDIVDEIGMFVKTWDADRQNYLDQAELIVSKQKKATTAGTPIKTTTAKVDMVGALQELYSCINPPLNGPLLAPNFCQTVYQLISILSLSLKRSSSDPNIDQEEENGRQQQAFSMLGKIITDSLVISPTINSAGNDDSVGELSKMLVYTAPYLFPSIQRGIVSAPCSLKIWINTLYSICESVTDKYSDYLKALHDKTINRPLTTSDSWHCQGTPDFYGMMADHIVGIVKPSQPNDIEFQTVESRSCMLALLSLFVDITDKKRFIDEDNTMAGLLQGFNGMHSGPKNISDTRLFRKLFKRDATMIPSIGPSIPMDIEGFNRLENMESLLFHVMSIVWDYMDAFWMGYVHSHLNEVMETIYSDPTVGVDLYPSFNHISYLGVMKDVLMDRIGTSLQRFFKDFVAERLVEIDKALKNVRDNNDPTEAFVETLVETNSHYIATTPHVSKKDAPYMEWNQQAAVPYTIVSPYTSVNDAKGCHFKSIRTVVTSLDGTNSSTFNFDRRLEVVTKLHRLTDPTSLSVLILRQYEKTLAENSEQPKLNKEGLNEVAFQSTWSSQLVTSSDHTQSFFSDESLLQKGLQPLDIDVLQTLSTLNQRQTLEALVEYFNTRYAWIGWHIRPLLFAVKSTQVIGIANVLSIPEDDLIQLMKARRGDITYEQPPIGVEEIDSSDLKPLSPPSPQSPNTPPLSHSPPRVIDQHQQQQPSVTHHHPKKEVESIRLESDERIIHACSDYNINEAMAAFLMYPRPSLLFQRIGSAGSVNCSPFMWLSHINKDGLTVDHGVATNIDTINSKAMIQHFVEAYAALKRTEMIMSENDPLSNMIHQKLVISPQFNRTNNNHDDDMEGDDDDESDILNESTIMKDNSILEKTAVRLCYRLDPTSLMDPNDKNWTDSVWESTLAITNLGFNSHSSAAIMVSPELEMAGSGYRIWSMWYSFLLHHLTRGIRVAYLENSINRMEISQDPSRSGDDSNSAKGGVYTLTDEQLSILMPTISPQTTPILWETAKQIRMILQSNDDPLGYINQKGMLLDQDQLTSLKLLSSHCQKIATKRLKTLSAKLSVNDAIKDNTKHIDTCLMANLLRSSRLVDEFISSVIKQIIVGPTRNGDLMQPELVENQLLATIPFYGNVKIHDQNQSIDPLTTAWFAIQAEESSQRALRKESQGQKGHTPNTIPFCLLFCNSHEAIWSARRQMYPPIKDITEVVGNRTEMFFKHLAGNLIAHVPQRISPTQISDRLAAKTLITLIDCNIDTIENNGGDKICHSIFQLLYNEWITGGNPVTVLLLMCTRLLQADIGQLIQLRRINDEMFNKMLTGNEMKSPINPSTGKRGRGAEAVKRIAQNDQWLTFTDSLNELCSMIDYKEKTRVGKSPLVAKEIFAILRQYLSVDELSTVMVALAVCCSIDTILDDQFNAFDENHFIVGALENEQQDENEKYHPSSRKFETLCIWSFLPYHPNWYSRLVATNGANKQEDPSNERDTLPQNYSRSSNDDISNSIDINGQSSSVVSHASAIIKTLTNNQSFSNNNTMKSLTFLRPTKMAQYKPDPQVLLKKSANIRLMRTFISRLKRPNIELSPLQIKADYSLVRQPMSETITQEMIDVTDDLLGDLKIIFSTCTAIGVRLIKYQELSEGTNQQEFAKNGRIQGVCMAPLWFVLYQSGNPNNATFSLPKAISILNNINSGYDVAHREHNKEMCYNSANREMVRIQWLDQLLKNFNPSDPLLHIAIESCLSHIGLDYQSALNTITNGIKDAVEKDTRQIYKNNVLTTFVDTFIYLIATIQQQIAKVSDWPLGLNEDGSLPRSLVYDINKEPATHDMNILWKGMGIYYRLIRTARNCITASRTDSGAFKWDTEKWKTAIVWVLSPFFDDKLPKMTKADWVSSFNVEKCFTLSSNNWLQYDIPDKVFEFLRTYGPSEIAESVANFATDIPREMKEIHYDYGIYKEKTLFSLSSNVMRLLSNWMVVQHPEDDSKSIAHVEFVNSRLTIAVTALKTCLDTYLYLHLVKLSYVQILNAIKNKRKVTEEMISTAEFAIRTHFSDCSKHIPESFKDLFVSETFEKGSQPTSFVQLKRSYNITLLCQLLMCGNLRDTMLHLFGRCSYEIFNVIGFFMDDTMASYIMDRLLSVTPTLPSPAAVMAVMVDSFADEAGVDSELVKANIPKLQELQNDILVKGDSYFGQRKSMISTTGVSITDVNELKERSVIRIRREFSAAWKDVPTSFAGTYHNLVFNHFYPTIVFREQPSIVEDRSINWERSEITNFMVDFLSKRLVTMIELPPSYLTHQTITLLVGHWLIIKNAGILDEGSNVSFLHNELVSLLYRTFETIALRARKDISMRGLFGIMQNVWRMVDYLKESIVDPYGSQHNILFNLSKNYQNGSRLCDMSIQSKSLMAFCVLVAASNNRPELKAWLEQTYSMSLSMTPRSPLDYVIGSLVNPQTIRRDLLELVSKEIISNVMSQKALESVLGLSIEPLGIYELFLIYADAIKLDTLIQMQMFCRRWHQRLQAIRYSSLKTTSDHNMGNSDTHMAPIEKDEVEPDHNTTWEEAKADPQKALNTAIQEIVSQDVSISLANKEEIEKEMEDDLIKLKTQIEQLKAIPNVPEYVVSDLDSSLNRLESRKGLILRSFSNLDGNSINSEIDIFNEEIGNTTMYYFRAIHGNYSGLTTMAEISNLNEGGGAGDDNDSDANNNSKRRQKELEEEQSFSYGMGSPSSSSQISGSPLIANDSLVSSVVDAFSQFWMTKHEYNGTPVSLTEFYDGEPNLVAAQPLNVGVSNNREWILTFPNRFSGIVSYGRWIQLNFLLYSLSTNLRQYIPANDERFNISGMMFYAQLLDQLENDEKEFNIVMGTRDRLTTVNIAIFEKTLASLLSIFLTLASGPLEGEDGANWMVIVNIGHHGSDKTSPINPIKSPINKGTIYVTESPQNNVEVVLRPKRIGEIENDTEDDDSDSNMSLVSSESESSSSRSMSPLGSESSDSSKEEDNQSPPFEPPPPISFSVDFESDSDSDSDISIDDLNDIHKRIYSSTVANQEETTKEYWLELIAATQLRLKGITELFDGKTFKKLTAKQQRTVDDVTEKLEKLITDVESNKVFDIKVVTSLRKSMNDIILKIRTLRNFGLIKSPPPSARKTPQRQATPPPFVPRSNPLINYQVSDTISGDIKTLENANNLAELSQTLNDQKAFFESHRGTPDYRYDPLFWFVRVEYLLAILKGAITLATLNNQDQSIIDNFEIQHQLIFNIGSEINRKSEEISAYTTHISNQQMDAIWKPVEDELESTYDTVGVLLAGVSHSATTIQTTPTVDVINAMFDSSNINDNEEQLPEDQDEANSRLTEITSQL